MSLFMLRSLIHLRYLLIHMNPRRVAESSLFKSPAIIWGYYPRCLQLHKQVKRDVEASKLLRAYLQEAKGLCPVRIWNKKWLGGT